MFSAIRGAAHLTRRATVPAALFGAGYTASWSQSRPESAPQLLAYTTAIAWSVTNSGVRSAGHAIQGVCPEEYRLEWPQRHLDQAETVELVVLFRLVEKYAEQGVDSALLRRLALRRLCECAEADPRGPAILALAGDDGLAGIVALLDENAVALAKASLETGNELLFKDSLLLPLTASLQAIVKSSKSRLDQELGVSGLLHLKRAALLSSTWLAESQKPGSSQKVADSAGISSFDAEQDHTMIVERLHSVWSALNLPGNASVLQRARRERGEVLELHRDVEARAQELGAVPAALPRPKPLVEFLPKNILAVMGGSSGGRDASGRTDRAAPADKKQPAASSAPADAKSGGPLKTINKVLEVTSWAILIAAGVVALSEDGFGLLPFHALPVALRPAVHGLIQRHSSRVEDLLAKHDSDMTGGSAQDSAGPTLGPWNAQPSYITGEAPDFQGPR